MTMFERRTTLLAELVRNGSLCVLPRDIIGLIHEYLAHSGIPLELIECTVRACDRYHVVGDYISLDHSVSCTVAKLPSLDGKSFMINKTDGVVLLPDGDVLIFDQQDCVSLFDNSTSTKYKASIDVNTLQIANLTAPWCYGPICCKRYNLYGISNVIEYFPDIMCYYGKNCGMMVRYDVSPELANTVRYLPAPGIVCVLMGAKTHICLPKHTIIVNAERVWGFGNGLLLALGDSITYAEINNYKLDFINTFHLTHNARIIAVYEDYIFTLYCTIDLMFITKIRVHVS